MDGANDNPSRGSCAREVQPGIAGIPNKSQFGRMSRARMSQGLCNPASLTQEEVGRPAKPSRDALKRVWFWARVEVRYCTDVRTYYTIHTIYYTYYTLSILYTIHTVLCILYCTYYTIHTILSRLLCTVLYMQYCTADPSNRDRIPFAKTSARTASYAACPLMHTTPTGRCSPCILSCPVRPLLVRDRP